MTSFRLTLNSCRRFCTSQKVGGNLLVNKSRSENGIFKIGINRPEKRNCINHNTAVQLLAAFQEFENDDTAKVAVLYGEGGYFCSGWDLSTLGDNNKELLNLDLKKYRPIGPTMMTCTKPVIAAVEGFAVAGGLELAITADLIVAADNSIFGVYNRRFGVPLVDGGTVRLPKIVGLSRALDMILSGRQITADKAYRWGLVNRLAASGESLSVAVKLAEEISQFPQICMNTDRRSAYYSAYDAKSYEDAFEFELKNGLPVLEKESVRGAQSFVKAFWKKLAKDFTQDPSLYSVKGIAILDNDGNRIIAKYYDDTFPTVKEQKAFEKNLFNKTNKANAEIILLDGMICVYRSNVDLFFYVMGGNNENELILVSVLNCIYDTISQILRKNVEKKNLFDSLDVVMLAMDEICDRGIILETDPAAVFQRVAFRSDEISFSEQSAKDIGLSLYRFYIQGNNDSNAYLVRPRNS